MNYHEPSVISIASDLLFLSVPVQQANRLPRLIRHAKKRYIWLYFR